MELLQSELFTIEFLGNSLLRWLIAAGIGLGITLAIAVVRWLVAHRFERFAQRSAHVYDDLVVDVVRATNVPLLSIPAFLIGARTLTFPEQAEIWMGTVAVLAFLLQVAIWGGALIRKGLERYARGNLETNAANVVTANALSFVAQLVLYSIVLLLALDNIPGVEVTTLIAGLGIGGIAVALALQSILSDLFASLSISLDKPFVLGDFIMVGDMLGSVEQIGLKTTRIRSLSGEQLIFANTDLLNSRIRNFKRMEQRRIVFRLGVLYETTADQLRSIPPMIREVIEAQPDTRFDRAHFFSFDDYALTFEVVYFVLSADYNKYMDIQQAINLAIFERFAAAGIGFAYPTQQLYLDGVLKRKTGANGDMSAVDEQRRSI